MHIPPPPPHTNTHTHAHTHTYTHAHTHPHTHTHTHTHTLTHTHTHTHVYTLPYRDDYVTFQLHDVFSSLDYFLSSQLIEFCPSHLDVFSICIKVRVVKSVKLQFRQCHSNKYTGLSRHSPCWLLPVMGGYLRIPSEC